MYSYKQTRDGLEACFPQKIRFLLRPFWDRSMQIRSSNQILGQWLSGLTYIIALEPRRAQANLCMLFKLVHGLCFFPPDIITTRPNHSQRTNKQLLLQQPFAGTNAYIYTSSFVSTAYCSCVELARTARLSRKVAYLAAVQ